MDYQVIWSPEALDDVDEIAAYIAKDSPFYAQSTIEQLIVAARKLANLPLRGREVPELNDSEYRECFVQSYRLIYRVEEAKAKVSVAAVIHGRRRLESVERFNLDEDQR